MKRYLAYGSNMDLRQMACRCPGAKLVGRGMLEGWRLAFRGSLRGNYATIEKSKGGRVPLLVWDITEADEAALDCYEGAPTFYFKQELCYTALDGDGEGTGMAYIMVPDRPYGFPGRSYLYRIRDAYADFGFDEKILLKALRYTRKKMK